MKLPFTKKPVKMPVFERPEYSEEIGFVELVGRVRYIQGLFEGGSGIFVVCYLDPKNRAIEVIEANEGTVDCAAVYPREIIQGALILGAASIVCFHNHRADSSPAYTIAKYPGHGFRLQGHADQIPSVVYHK